MKKGNNYLEFIIILSFITLAAIQTLNLIGKEIRSMYTRLNNNIAYATTETTVQQPPACKHNKHLCK